MARGAQLARGVPGALMFRAEGLGSKSLWLRAHGLDLDCRLEDSGFGAKALKAKKELALQAYSL